MHITCIYISWASWLISVLFRIWYSICLFCITVENNDFIGDQDSLGMLLLAGGVWLWSNIGVGLVSLLICSFVFSFRESESGLLILIGVRQDNAKRYWDRIHWVVCVLQSIAGILWLCSQIKMLLDIVPNDYGVYVVAILLSWAGIGLRTSGVPLVVDRLESIAWMLFISRGCMNIFMFILDLARFLFYVTLIIVILASVYFTEIEPNNNLSIEDICWTTHIEPHLSTVLDVFLIITFEEIYGRSYNISQSFWRSKYIRNLLSGAHFTLRSESSSNTRTKVVPTTQGLWQRIMGQTVNQGVARSTSSNQSSSSTVSGVVTTQSLWQIMIGQNVNQGVTQKSGDVSVVITLPESRRYLFAFFLFTCLTPVLVNHFSPNAKTTVKSENCF